MSGAGPAAPRPALPDDLERQVAAALREDLGADWGDNWGETPGAGSGAGSGENWGDNDPSGALVPAGHRCEAAVYSREDAVLCGTAWFDQVFRSIDPGIECAWRRNDGEGIAAGQVVCRLQGPTRALLSGERTALNFLQLLSGTATISRAFAAAAATAAERAGVSAAPCVLDTRKTLPGLRSAQKYAVACGGCRNHRRNLGEAILLKENHIAALGGVAAALRAARQRHGARPVEIEVQNPRQLQEALEQRAERILLDNFSPAQIAAAVRDSKQRAQLEVSGGVTLAAVTELAGLGMDFLSCGALTKDVRAVDFSLRLDGAGGP